MVKKKTVFSKEVKEIFDNIDVFCRKHKGEVAMHVNLVAFDKESNVIDNGFGFFGCKKVLEVMLKDGLEVLKKEKEDFVNI